MNKAMDFSSFRFHRIASPREVADRKKETADQLQPSQSPENQKLPQLSRDLIEYLRIIHESPGLPATTRDDQFNISRRKGSVLRKRLSELDLIESQRVAKVGKGRPYDDVSLTQRGLALMEAPENKSEKNFAWGEKKSDTSRPNQTSITDGRPANHNCPVGPTARRITSA